MQKLSVRAVELRLRLILYVHILRRLIILLSTHGAYQGDSVGSFNVCRRKVKAKGSFGSYKELATFSAHSRRGLSTQTTSEWHGRR